MKIRKGVKKSFHIKITDKPVKSSQCPPYPISLIVPLQYPETPMREITLPTPEVSFTITKKETILKSEHRSSYLQICTTRNPITY